jgi:hypothetical protein
VLSSNLILNIKNYFNKRNLAVDEEPKKEHKLPSMLEMSEMFDKVQSQMNPLSYNLKKLNSILGIASQYEHLNPAMSVGEIARKAFEQQNLASASVIASSVSAGLAQPQIREAIALQDSFRKIAEGQSVNNNAMLAAERATQGMDRNNVYKDAMSSFSQFRNSLKPLKDSLNTAGNAFNGSEFANLVRELQTSRVIPESILSEYSGIFKQFESLHNLESFKAIYRLKNFPNEKLWMRYYDEATRLTEDSLAEVKKIDARISDEISSADDFNDLKEDTRHDLEEVYFSYYHLIIISYMYYIFILKEYVIKSIDYSKMRFNFVGSSSSVIVGAYLVDYQPNFNNVLDSIVGGIILMKFANHLDK